MRTLCPPAFRRGSISSSAVSFPEAATSASARLPSCAATRFAATSSPNRKGWQHTLRSCMRRLLSFVNCADEARDEVLFGLSPPESDPPSSSPPITFASNSVCSAMHRPLSSASFSDVALDEASFPNRPCSPSSRVLYHCLCESDRGIRTTVSVLGGRILCSTAAFVRRSMRGCRSDRAAATAESSPNAAAPSASIFSAPAASRTSWKRTETKALSSWRLFCSGVPVSNNAAVVRMRRTACETSDESFLTRCASSRTR